MFEENLAVFREKETLQSGRRHMLALSFLENLLHTPHPELQQNHKQIAEIKLDCIGVLTISI